MIDVNQITSTLRGLPDPALQQYAAMHKNDPYILSLAVAESNQRKQMRASAQARMAGQQMPKVADQDIAAMAPVTSGYGGQWQTEHGGRVQTELPEDQGIARLPTPNIQGMADGGIAGYGDDANEGMGMAMGGSMFDFAQHSEPVLRMAAGGMPGFAKGDGIKVYEDRIRAEALRQGVDPDIAVRMFKRESGGDRYAVSPKGAAGLGQLMPDTAAEMGLSDEDRFDPDKSIPASVGYLKKQLVKYKGDPEKALAAYNWGAGNVDKHLAKNEGKLSRVGLPKETADYLNNILPIGSAQAETAPAKQKAAAPADTSLAAQIPGQSYTAPASDYDKTNSFFGRMADKMGIPLEAQRNISNALNAPTPLAAFSGAYAAPKGKSGIVALGEKLGDKIGLLQGPAGRMSAAEVAALKNEQAGLRALENSQLAMKEAQSAGATLEEQEYLRKMMEANNAAKIPSAAEKISNASLAREGQDVATAQRLMKTTEQAQAASRADALANQAFPSGGAATAPTASPTGINTSGADLDAFYNPEGAMPDKKDVVNAAKEAAPEAKRKGFTDDDWLTLGLNLMANKNPNFFTALGESGLQTLAGKKEREKTEREEAKLKGLEELQKAQAKYYSAYGEAIDRGAKEKNDALLAEKAISDYMTSWDKAMVNKMGSVGDPTARAKVEEAYRQRIYAQMGIDPIMAKQSAAPSGGGGFKFLGVG